jgi:hypothetical protein
VRVEYNLGLVRRGFVMTATETVRKESDMNEGGGGERELSDFS